MVHYLEQQVQHWELTIEPNLFFTRTSKRQGVRELNPSNVASYVSLNDYMSS